jgi:hypothetical protein
MNVTFRKGIFQRRVKESLTFHFSQKPFNRRSILLLSEIITGHCNAVLYYLHNNPVIILNKWLQIGIIRIEYMKKTVFVIPTGILIQQVEGWNRNH